MSLTIAKRIEKDTLKDICQILLGTFFLAMFAKIYIPLFFTPVPIILQNSIAISYGFFLGPKKSVFSVLLFIFLGIIGLPFFSNGNFGIDFILNTNGGYILSYFIASFVVGEIFQKNSDLTQRKIGLTILLGHLIVLFGGSIWFSYFVGLKKALLLGVVPFIAIDILKSIVITKAIQLKNSYF
ncbi:MAG: Biotin transporter BioY2 [Candidatus Anoxychlamydiales bacterium]|nr:Biotin transporter BioY2 [Candidatus Anoxychlamydiales bacterium]